MRNSVIISTIITLLIGVTAYLATNNYIIAIAIVVVFEAYYLFVCHKRIKRYFVRIEQSKNCCNFVNSFLISLSVRDSLLEAYSSATTNPDKGFAFELQQLSEMNIEDRLVYLRKYFNLAIYKMFLNVLELYQDQGGNVLTLSNQLIQELSRIQTSLFDIRANNRRRVIEFTILWVITFGIVVFIRFSLNDFYLTMLKSTWFIVLLIGFFLLVLLSVHLLLINCASFKYKEDIL